MTNLGARTDKLANLRRLASDFRNLCDLRMGEWPELELTAVKISDPHSRPTDEALFTEMCEVLDDPARQAWVRFRSDVQWSGSEREKAFERIGPPIYAEWTEGPQKSGMLRLDGSSPGRARIWHYEDRPISDTDELLPGEVPVLRESASFLGAGSRIPGQRLLYSVYWGAPEERHPYAIRRQLFRFSGFSIEESQ